MKSRTVSVFFDVLQSKFCRLPVQYIFVLLSKPKSSCEILFWTPAYCSAALLFSISPFPCPNCCLLPSTLVDSCPMFNCSPVQYSVILLFCMLPIACPLFCFHPEPYSAILMGNTVFYCSPVQTASDCQIFWGGLLLNVLLFSWSIICCSTVFLRNSAVLLFNVLMFSCPIFLLFSCSMFCCYFVQSSVA